jgi:chromosome segregation ATPase
MFGKHRRRIAELEDRCARLSDRLTEVTEERDTARSLGRQLTRRINQVTDERDNARSLITKKVLASYDVDELRNKAAGYGHRIGRLARACARYRAEIVRLASTAAALQRIIDDREDCADRAVRPAQPTPESVRLAAELRREREHSAQLEEKVHLLQQANIDADFAPLTAAA